MPRGKKLGDPPAKKAMRDAQAEVQGVNSNLRDAREVYGPNHPTIKKLQADSIAAVGKRSAAIRRVQGR